MRSHAEPVASTGGDAAHYYELEVELAPESEEVWGLFCYERGATGALSLEQTARRCVVLHYFESLPPDVAETWPREFGGRFPRLTVPRRLAVRRKPVADWQNEWQVHFQPLPVASRFLVCPPWDVPHGAARAGGRIPLVILPGQGFGTGRHPSTALALGLLERAVGAAPPRRMLDVGTGSGILAVGAALLGVAEAWGVDVDRTALPEVRHNFGLNGLPAPRLVQGSADSLSGCFPLVVANITAAVLTAQREHLLARTEVGGALIVSGMLTAEGDALLKQFEALGMAPVDSAEQEGWVACCLRRVTAEGENGPWQR